jgi:hypothetical protein
MEPRKYGISKVKKVKGKAVPVNKAWRPIGL